MVELTHFLILVLTLHFAFELTPLPTTPGLVVRCSGGNLDPRCGSRMCAKTPAFFAGGLAHILQVKFLLCTNFSKAKILGGADDALCHRREPAATPFRVQNFRSGTWQPARPAPLPTRLVYLIRHTVDDGQRKRGRTWVLPRLVMR